MKRCPECRRDYLDETLLYCLDDGNMLLEGPASMDGPATAMLPPSNFASEAGTLAQIHTTEKTAVFPTVAAKKPFQTGRWIAVGVLALLLIGAAAAAYFKFSAIKSPELSFESAKFTRITNHGSIGDSAISPDGKWMVYVAREGQTASIWLQQVSVASSASVVISKSI